MEHSTRVHPSTHTTTDDRSAQGHHNVMWTDSFSRGCVFAIIALGGHGAVAGTSDCFSITNLASKAECYSAVAKQRQSNGDKDATAEAIYAADVAETYPQDGWDYTTLIDQMTDLPTSKLEIASDQNLPSKPGHLAERAYLTIWCYDNTTQVGLTYGSWFMAETSGFGRVTYRVDDKKAAVSKMEADTTNAALNLFGGKRAIPFIKQLLGGTKLMVRAAPYREDAMDVTFTIAGIDKAVEPLRQACGW